MGVLSGQVHHINGIAPNPGPATVDLTDGKDMLVSKEIVIRNAEATGGSNLLVQFEGQSLGDYFTLRPNGGLSVSIGAKSILVKGDGGAASYEIIVVYRS